MVAIPAEPYAFDFRPACAALLIIDMQRDFMEPGGFGESLGNDVSLLRRTIVPAKRVLDAARKWDSKSYIRGKVTAPTFPICLPRRKSAAILRLLSVMKARWAVF